MIVHVRLFARARDLAHTDQINASLDEGATVADLRRQLAADYPALAKLLEHSAVAVENDFADDSRVLPANAEVALLPPVSGGQARGTDVSSLVVRQSSFDRWDRRLAGLLVWWDRRLAGLLVWWDRRLAGLLVWWDRRLAGLLVWWDRRLAGPLSWWDR
ncbi:MAG TPA: MoaD/ThiS family protein, partial [Gemmataceae bacterium]|nr:MoaD/ThiS family protein [Gemmataceae bacterium]